MAGGVFERLRKEQAVCQRRGNTQELQVASKTVSSHGTEINLGSAHCGVDEIAASGLGQHELVPEVPRQDVQDWGWRQSASDWLKYFSDLYQL